MAPSTLCVVGKEGTFMFPSYLQREGFHFCTNHKALIFAFLFFSPALSIFFFPPSCSRSLPLSLPLLLTMIGLRPKKQSVEMRRG